MTTNARLAIAQDRLYRLSKGETISVVYENRAAEFREDLKLILRDYYAKEKA